MEGEGEVTHYLCGCLNAKRYVHVWLCDQSTVRDPKEKDRYSLTPTCQQCRAILERLKHVKC